MKKKIMIFIIILLIFLSGIALFHKYSNTDKSTNNNFNRYSIYTLEKYYDNSNEVLNLDKDLYNEYIFWDNILSINYTLFDDENSINGKFYISDIDKTLHITNTNEDIDYKISNIKFKSLVKKNFEYYDGIYIYALSEDGKIYKVILKTNNIKETKLEDMLIKFKAINFVSLEFNSDIFAYPLSILALSEDGNIYDILSKIRFSQDITLLGNFMYVLKDGRMINIYGKILANEVKEYKAKYILKNYDEEENEFAIITEDNELLFFTNANQSVVAEYNKKIKTFDFNANKIYESSKLTITFDDNSKIEFNAACTTMYCPVKLN